MFFTNDQVRTVAKHAANATEGGGAGYTAYAKGSTPRRYVVGGYARSLMLPVGQDSAVTRAAIHRMVGSTVEGAETLGVWEDRGAVYVDLGTTYYSLDLALEEAAQRGELAVYDRQEGVCIRVN